MPRIGTNPRDIAAIQGNVSDEAVLGYLVWYSVADVRIPRGDLEALFQQVGLDEKHLPPLPRGHDVFLRATSVLNGIEFPFNNGSDQPLTARLLVRKVTRRGGRVAQKLVREIVDDQKVRLSYDEVADMEYDAGRFTLTVRPGFGEERNYQADVDVIAAEFKALSGVMIGQAIRATVRDILRSCRPTVVRPSGAVYFVPRGHFDTLVKLAELIEALAEYKVTQAEMLCEVVPLVDATRQRMMVGHQFRQQVTAELDDMAEKLAEVLRGEKTMRPRTAAGYVERFQELKEQVREYEAILEEDLGLFATRVDLLSRQLAAAVGI